MYRKLIIALSIIALGVLGFVLWNGNYGPSAGKTTGNRSLGSVPSLTLSDYEGNAVALSAWKGTPLVVNSWAVWCPFCREELPDLARLQEEFEGEAVVIAIDRAESREKAQGFTDELGITDDIIFLLDAEDAFYKAIGGFAMPETIFVNSEGEIIVHKRGFMELSEMREHTRKIVE